MIIYTHVLDKKMDEELQKFGSAKTQEREAYAGLDVKKVKITALSHCWVNLGEEPYPQIPPNGEWLSPKFEKSEIGNFRKQNEFSPKIKFGGYGWKAAGLEQSKIIAKPVKYIVPGICDRDTKRGKFAKQMNQ